jgi:hypothetical protein
MASNDPEPTPIEPPDNGAVAFLTRIVRIPGRNDQSPLRAVYLCIIAATLSVTPMPFNAVGFVFLVALALSLGRITEK